MKPAHQRDTCMPMFSCGTSHNSWVQMSSADEQINKISYYICHEISCSLKKWNPVICSTMEGAGVDYVNDMRQTQKDEYHMFLLLWGNCKSQPQWRIIIWVWEACYNRGLAGKRRLDLIMYTVCSWISY
jgi:hypothetical protein